MGMIIDGVAASEQPDSSAEIFSVKGADISDFLSGRAVLNWEHGNGSPEDIIGRVIYTKKIYKLADCDDEREKKYWNFVKVPYIYVKVELFDGDGHPGAVSAAAMVRHYSSRNLPILVRFSIEGSTLSQKGPLLEKTICRKLAATIKPANKTAVTGLVSDDWEGQQSKSKDEDSKKMAEDPLAFLLENKKSENPDYRKLGYSPTITYSYLENPVDINKIEFLTQKLEKAIEAGSYNAAPSSLVGGAALQRESIGQDRIRNRCKSALRDYDPYRHGPFRTYLANELPDVSNSFLDRFADAVGDWKVAKKQMLKSELNDHKNDYEDFLKKRKSIQFRDNAQLEGKKKNGRRDYYTSSLPIKPNPYFSNEFGALVDSKGAHGLEHPDSINLDGKNEIYNEAIRNWAKVHGDLQDGKLDDDLAATALIYGSSSPNTYVPLQELSVAHKLKHGNEPVENYAEYSRDMDKMANGYSHYDWKDNVHEHVMADLLGKELDKYSVGVGQIPSNYADYNTLHHTLKHMILDHKSNKNGFLHGIDTVISQYDNKNTNSLANIRKIMGFLGYGTMVPDSHFFKKAFGKEKGDLVNHLGNYDNSHLIHSLEDYYANKHPYGEFAWSRMNSLLPGNNIGRDHMSLPASWAQFLSNVQYPVYKNAINRIMDKYDISNRKLHKSEDSAGEHSSLIRAAHAFRELEHEFGYSGASLAFHSIISNSIKYSKINKLANKLLNKSEPKNKDEEYHWNGADIKPGVIKIHGFSGQPSKRLQLLEEGPERHFIRDPVAKKVHWIDASNSRAFKIESSPKMLSTRSSKVRAKIHGALEHSDSPEQIALIDGLDMGQSPSVTNNVGITGMKRPTVTGIYKNAKGDKVFVKPSKVWAADDHELGYSGAHREAAYYQLAKDFFGLGKHVPVTTAFFHPVTGEPYSAQALVDGAEHYSFSSPEHAVIIHNLSEDGTLDKLHLMDHILNQNDRHNGNYMLSPKSPFLHLIDNGSSMLDTDITRADGKELPVYFDPNYHVGKQLSAKPIHPEAENWLLGLDPTKLAKQLATLKVPKVQAEHILDKLLYFQHKVSVTRGMSRELVRILDTQMPSLGV